MSNTKKEVLIFYKITDANVTGWNGHATKSSYYSDDNIEVWFLIIMVSKNVQVLKGDEWPRVSIPVKAYFSYFSCTCIMILYIPLVWTLLFQIVHYWYSPTRTRWLCQSQTACMLSKIVSGPLPTLASMHNGVQSLLFTTVVLKSCLSGLIRKFTHAWFQGLWGRTLHTRYHICADRCWLTAFYLVIARDNKYCLLFYYWGEEGNIVMLFSSRVHAFNITCM